MEHNQVIKSLIVGTMSVILVLVCSDWVNVKKGFFAPLHTWNSCLHVVAVLCGGVLASKSLLVIRAGCASNQCHACSTTFIHWSMCVELLYASLLLFVCGWDHYKCVFVSCLSLFQPKIHFHTWLVWLKTTDWYIQKGNRDSKQWKRNRWHVVCVINCVV